MSQTALEGCENQERLLEERRRALGEEHPETLAAMLDLADCLWTQGRLIAARKLEGRVVAARRLQLGEDHFDTLKAVGKLAVTMAAQGELTEARRLFSAHGDFEAARDLLEGVVAASCREFGEQHPESLTAMSNLASILWQHGYWGEAYTLQHHVVDLRRRINGDSDPATLAAAGVLEIMERDAGL